MAASSNLASSQVRIKAASMNLGGIKTDFMTNAKMRLVYEKRLPKEVLALLRGRDLVGLTELNPRWFEWLMANPAFTQNGRYRAVSDGVDCALIWDSFEIEPTDPTDPVKVLRIFNDNEIPGGFDSNPARYNWRQFMAVIFKRLASPQVSLTPACTHSIRGSTTKGSRITNPGKNPTLKMSKIARKAMEKVVTQLHVPSSAAGNPDYLTFIMGDWKNTAEAMRKDVDYALSAAAAPGVLAECITAERAVERDHVVGFTGSSKWTAELDDNIAPQIYADFEACTGEHYPVFFHIQGDFAQPDVQIRQPAPPVVVTPPPPWRPIPALEAIPASTRDKVNAASEALMQNMRAVYKRLFPDIPVPAPPFLVICVLELLSQVRRGQTKTDLFEGFSWKYFPFSSFASKKS